MEQSWRFELTFYSREGVNAALFVYKWPFYSAVTHFRASPTAKGLNQMEEWRKHD
jgi:hypothetical protein